MMMRSFLLRGGVAAVALALCACGRSPRVNFYTLEPVVQAQAPPAVTAARPAQADDRAPSVVVGPVTLPETVDRPQLVVRVDANRVEILEEQRWAEPLKTELPRVIAQNLRRQLNSERVASYLQHAGTLAEYRVLLDFLRFESVPGDAVTVEANWTVKGPGAGAPRTGRSLVREKIAGKGYDALVAAYGRALDGVSAQLAAAIRAESAVK